MRSLTRRRLRGDVPPSHLRLPDLGSEALAGLLQRPGRSALTLLGVMLGIGSFVTIVGIAQTASGQIGKQFNVLYRDRMEMELDMFKRKGVFDYFVIIGDIVRWAKSDKPLPSVRAENPFAKKKPIRVGACRGSAGASLVSTRR